MAAMTAELDAAIRQQWPGIDWTWQDGTFTRWTPGAPPTEAELQTALDAYRAAEAERQQQRAADLQTLRSAAAVDPRFAALLRVLGL